METEKVLEMFECVYGNLQSLWLFESGYNEQIDIESGSYIRSWERRQVIKRFYLSKKKKRD